MSQTALQQQLGEIEDEIVSLNDLLTDTDLSDAEKEKIDTQIDEQMSRRKIIAKRVEREKATLEMVNQGATPRAEKPAQAVQSIEQVNDRAIPKEYLQRVNVRHYEPVNFKGQRADMDAAARSYYFGKYCLAVASATSPGVYGHLQHHRPEFENKFGPLNAATEGANAGFYVPEQFGTDLVSLMLSYGVARQLCRVVPMTSDTRTDPKEGADPTPVFEGELSAGNDITPTDESNVRLVAKKLMGILVQSAELSEDAIMEYGDSMMRRLANGFAKKEDDCFIAGDGTSTYGGIVGCQTKIFNLGNTAPGHVEGAGSTWTSLTRLDFSKTVAALPHYADGGPEDNPSTVWLCHRSFYYEVMFDLALEQSGAEAREMINGISRPMFMGFPVRFANSMPKTTASGATVCLLGDFARACTFGDRRAFSISFSTEATIGSTNMFESYGLATRAFERFDINVHSVGDTSDAGPIVGLVTQ